MRRAETERGRGLKRRVDLWVGCALVAVLSLLRRRRPPPVDTSRIGLLMFGVIGDTLLASAIVHDLKRVYPFARIIAFISIANRGTLDLLDGFDEVVVVPITRPLAAIPMIRRFPIDLLIDIGQWARISALTARLARARFTVGFKTRRQFRHFAYDAVVEHSPVRHEIDNFRALLRGVGIQGGRSLPRLKPALLAEAAVAAPRPYVVFHPWASGYRSEQREWGSHNWRALGSAVLDWGYDIVITGGPEDAARAESLAAAIADSERITVLAGHATLRDTAVALGRAAAVVCVNTGVMHLAALLNAPMVALHGPTNARRWGPLSSAAVAVCPGPDTGCGFLNLGFEYPRSPPACMARITVTDVVRPLRAMLAPPATIAVSTPAR